MRPGTISLKRFYIRRSLRILPIYVTYLLVLGVLTALGLYHDALSSWIGALTFTRNMIGQGRSATVQLWSLAVEEQLLSGVADDAFRVRLVAAVPCVRVRCCCSGSRRAQSCGRRSCRRRPADQSVHRIFGVQSGLMQADSLLIVGCLAAFLIERTAQAPASAGGAARQVSRPRVCRLSPVTRRSRWR